jgi:hypothetical protein
VTAPYPTLTDVEACEDPVQIVRWNRFLPSPRSDEEVEVINGIFKRFGELEPAERTRASKAVGW